VFDVIIALVKEMNHAITGHTTTFLHTNK